MQRAVRNRKLFLDALEVASMPPIIRGTPMRSSANLKKVPAVVLADGLGTLSLTRCYDGSGRLDTERLFDRADGEGLLATCEIHFGGMEPPAQGGRFRERFSFGNTESLAQGWVERAHYSLRMGCQRLAFYLGDIIAQPSLARQRTKVEALADYLQHLRI